MHPVHSILCYMAALQLGTASYLGPEPRQFVIGHQGRKRRGGSVIRRAGAPAAVMCFSAS